MTVPEPRREDILPLDLERFAAALARRANLLSTHEGAGRVHLREAISAAMLTHRSTHVTADVFADALADVIAHELRALAEELHYR